VQGLWADRALHSSSRPQPLRSVRVANTDADLLREIIVVIADRTMEMDVAAHGER
jgi:hypothetical protein